MIGFIIKKIIGSKNDREVKRLRPMIARMNEFEAALQSAIDARGVEFICLAGFMRLFTADFVNRWHGRMLNIHPSLLPSFPGLDPQQFMAGRTGHMTMDRIVGRSRRHAGSRFR